MAPTLEPPKRTVVESYTPVGKCIYCGTLNDLTDEHTFPFSLQGTRVLPKASCKKCAGVTSAIERRVCDMLATFRQVHKIQTRRKKKRTGKIVVTDDQGKELQIPDEGVSAFYPTIKLHLPGYYRMDEWRPSKTTPGPSKAVPPWAVGTKLSMVPVPARDMKVFNEYAKMGYTQMSEVFDIEGYALLMAKIAHCLCVGRFGVDNFEHILPRFILGEKEIPFRYSSKRPPSLLDISFFVGSFQEDIAPRPWYNEFALGTQESASIKGFYSLFAGIRLFASLGEPMACVVAGMVHESKYENLLAYERENKGCIMRTVSETGVPTERKESPPETPSKDPSSPDS